MHNALSPEELTLIAIQREQQDLRDPARDNIGRYRHREAIRSDPKLISLDELLQILIRRNPEIRQKDANASKEEKEKRAEEKKGEDAEEATRKKAEDLRKEHEETTKRVKDAEEASAKEAKRPRVDDAAEKQQKKPQIPEPLQTEPPPTPQIPGPLQTEPPPSYAEFSSAPIEHSDGPPSPQKASPRLARTNAEELKYNHITWPMHVIAQIMGHHDEHDFASPPKTNVRSGPICIP